MIDERILKELETIKYLKELIANKEKEITEKEAVLNNYLESIQDEIKE